MTNSYDIRRQSYRLIHFGKYPYNWPAYSESLGTIINLLIYFDSTEGGAFTIDKNDFDSPYYYDLNGDIQKKNITVDIVDPSKILSMDEINQSYK